jgi:hypothetical protein
MGAVTAESKSGEPPLKTSGRGVVRASASGSLLASLLTAAILWADSKMQSAGQPFELGTRQLTLLFLIAFSLGTIVSSLALFEILTVLGGERMSGWPVLAVIATGAAAGAALGAIPFALLGDGTRDLLWFAGFGGLYGGSVAGFWAYFARRVKGNG